MQVADVPAAVHRRVAQAEPLLGYARAQLSSSTQSPVVALHIGPIKVSADGATIQPKLNIGMQGGWLYLMAGIRDVRDGLAFECLGMIIVTYHGEGRSLEEFLRSVRCDNPVPMISFLVAAVPRILWAIAHATDIDVASDAYGVKGSVMFYIGLGLTAGVYLGWRDTRGYRMLGVEGRVASGFGLGATLRAGVHDEDGSVRVVCFLANVGLDCVFCPAEPPSGGGDGRVLVSGAAIPPLVDALPAREGDAGRLPQAMAWAAAAGPAPNSTAPATAAAASSQCAAPAAPSSEPACDERR